MSQDKMRDEFEAWYSKEYLTYGESMLRTIPRHDGNESDSSDYQRVYEEMSWLAWKASREAVVVELPKIECEYLETTVTRSIVRECRKAIEAAGIRTK